MSRPAGSASRTRRESRAAARELWRRPPLPLWAAVAIAAAGGLAFDLSFPGVGAWPLAFLAVTAQLVALIGRRAWSAVLVGLAFGVCFYYPHIDWMRGFLGDDPLRWVPWVALAGVEAVFMGLGAVLITLGYRFTDGWGGRARTIAVPTLVAGLWTLREQIMGSWPYGGFAWGRVGMSQSESPIAPVVSWVGVAGLTFLMVWLCAMGIEAVRTYARARRGGLPPARWALVPVPFAALLVLLVAAPQFPTAVVGTITVGAVQGNGPTAYFDDREYLDPARAQLDASGPVADADVDVALWPEGGIGGDPMNDPQAAAVLDAATELYGAPLIANAAVAVGADDIYNTSMVWEDGGPTQTHAKRHPVPFGEYVPNREIFERIVPSLIGMLQREYTPGTDAPLFEVAGARIGLAICFDVISDSLVREGATDGAQVYMLQTNNADFRDSDESVQQLAFARMRAIETGRTVVNLSTVGVSEIIASDGAALDRVEAGEAGAMVDTVELREGLTPAMTIGPWLAPVLTWGALAALVVIRIARRR
ncbi:apolipoprotein N-acyltransferase [Microbacterium halophytorum]|uniref:apolipoprotein N-acyltransferase n=1 Tax=Microbacterium halophytorum TaxID=2067568 RepID=UPI001E4CCFF4|nr:apolipoprotein N-acyltransferase [Microbacterium halophytorum]